MSHIKESDQAPEQESTTQTERKQTTTDWSKARPAPPQIVWPIYFDEQTDPESVIAIIRAWHSERFDDPLPETVLPLIEEIMSKVPESPGLKICHTYRDKWFVRNDGLTIYCGIPYEEPPGQDN